MDQYDVAVIGGGVAGLSVAYVLSEHCNVILLEREDQLACHSSGRTAAMYIEGYENRVVQELTLAGRDFFFDPPEGFSEYPLLSPCGGLTVASKSEMRILEKYFSRWSGSCPELSLVSADETLELVPILRPEWLGGAAYDPSWKNIDVHALLMGFERGVLKNGGQIRKKSEVLKMTESSKGWRLQVDEDCLEAKVSVNAAGAWANEFASIASVAPKPLTPMRRTAAIIPAPERVGAWPLVHTISESLYFRPESPGMMVCPQDETPSEPMDAFALEIDVAQTIEQYQIITGHQVDQVLRSWAGLRTFAQDRKPVVGFASESQNFFWLAGQGGFGVQTAPGLGRLASSLILNRGQSNPDIDANRF